MSAAPSSPSLPHLACRTSGDDRQVIETLWDLHSEDVLRYCRRMLGNAAEAADVTQKVFEQAIRGLDRLRGIDDPRRWLIGIARHRCLDHARSARRAPELVDAATLCRIAGASLLAEPCEDSRTLQLLGECLERLHAHDRTLIELRFYKGLPFKEIARQLGRTPAALRVRLTRACVRLRGDLKIRLTGSSRHPPTRTALRGRGDRSTSHVVMGSEVARPLWPSLAPAQFS